MCLSHYVVRLAHADDVFDLTRNRTNTLRDDLKKKKIYVFYAREHFIREHAFHVSALTNKNRTDWTTFFPWRNEGRKEGNVLFNDALNFCF